MNWSELLPLRSYSSILAMPFMSLSVSCNLPRRDRCDMSNPLPVSDKIRLDSRSRNSLRIVPDKHCSSVKIRTLKGVRNKPAGIPLGQAGIRFADQHKPGFDDYRYIEIKFNKDESVYQSFDTRSLYLSNFEIDLQDFIGDFKAVMQEWRERCDPIQNFRDLQRNPRIRVKSTTIIDPE